MNNDQSLSRAKWECKYHLTNGKSAIHIVREYFGYKFWARDFHVSTVCKDEEAIRKYIWGQEKEDRRVDQLGLWKYAPPPLRWPMVFNRFERSHFSSLRFDRSLLAYQHQTLQDS